MKDQGLVSAGHPAKLILNHQQSEEGNLPRGFPLLIRAERGGSNAAFRILRTSCKELGFSFSSARSMLQRAGYFGRSETPDAWWPETDKAGTLDAGCDAWLFPDETKDY
jgi:hypothetical protein